MATDVREQLAAYAHEAWASYMDHMFSKCKHPLDGTVIIPAEYAYNLKRLIACPYDRLVEREKEGDRKEADQMLAIVNSGQVNTTPPPAADGQ